MKKVCSKCGEEKGLDCFHKNKKTKDGLTYWCKSCKSKNGINYYKQNKEKIKTIVREYEKNNRKKINEAQKKWKEKNKEKVKLYQKKSNNKRKTDNMYKLRCNISTLIRQGMYKKKYLKKTKTQNIIGCSFEEFKRHLQSQFQEGMTWDNYGRNGWHIDHIYPVSKARDKEHLLELNHYTNLQPLWEKDNLSKGNRLDWSE